MLRTNRIFVAALLAGGLGASACLAGSVAEAATPIKYGGTLRVVMPWGSIVDDFNPLAWAGSTSTTAGGTGSLLYEPLFYDNPYTGNVTPLLGTSYKWEDNNLELVVTTRSGVTWSDGQPFSAKDVAFTFNYIKKYPALDPEGFWQGPLASVTATEPNIVVFKFNKADTPIFPLLVEQEIVPQHIWASITDRSEICLICHL
jgi:peptide/nickel transport system substrate-binding protein